MSKHTPVPTDPIQRLRMIEQHPDSIQRIKNPTEDEQMLAVDLKPETIKYVAGTATKAVREQALTNDYTVIQFIKDPTPEEETYVICNVEDGFRLIKNPSDHAKNMKDLRWLQNHKIVVL